MQTDRQVVLEKTVAYVRDQLAGEGSGHDWWHVYRVWQLARRISGAEGADMYVVELASLLHDIADWKFNGGNEAVGPAVAEAWLRGAGAAGADIERICEIIKEVSFKGAGTPTSPPTTLEGAVVQDADRLDALGAIGIARAFAYGGFAHRQIHDPAIRPTEHGSFEAYKASRSTTINHFYEKLLLLKDLMNTETARAIATRRHALMEVFLSEFYSEWEGRT